MDIFKKEYHKYGATDVEAIYNFYFKWLLSKLYELFKINNLPENIDEIYLWNCLYLNGNVCFTEMKGNLQAVTGSPGGEPNEFYTPTLYTVSNPVLGNKNVRVYGANQDGVMVYLTKTDKAYNYLPGCSGIYQLLKQTATLLADNIVSINTAQINTRVQATVTADSPALRTSAEAALKKLYEGKPYQVLEQNLLDKISVQPMATASTSTNISQLIELQQYIIGQFFNNLGIKSNQINKKERLITDEINSVDNFLAITLDSILETLTEGFEEVNKLFGTEITVELNDILKPVIEQAEEANEEISEDSNNDSDKQESGKESDAE